MKRLPDYISDIVDVINVTSTCYYMFGNWTELCVDLADKKADKSLCDSRYPVFLLHNDYSERQENNKVTCRNVKIYIICQSEPNISTQERRIAYYDEILNPLYDALISNMRKGSNFRKINSVINHDRKDLYRLYIGDKINRLPDDLDAVETNFNDLVYNLKKCT